MSPPRGSFPLFHRPECFRLLLGGASLWPLRVECICENNQKTKLLMTTRHRVTISGCCRTAGPSVFGTSTKRGQPGLCALGATLLLPGVCVSERRGQEPRGLMQLLPWPQPGHQQPQTPVLTWKVGTIVSSQGLAQHWTLPGAAPPLPRCRRGFLGFVAWTVLASASCVFKPAPTEPCADVDESHHHP